MTTSLYDYLSRQRTGVQPQALHYSYEKAGLVLDNQPIPWNANAVLVEARLHLRGQQSRTREDFLLKVSGTENTVVAESVKVEEPGDLCRVFFRLPPFAQTALVEIQWRGKSLGQLSLPILSEEEFTRHLSLEWSTLSAHLGTTTVQCQAVVGTQCQNILATALLSSATSLVPILDLGLRVVMEGGKNLPAQEVALHFCSSQMRGRQALISAVLPRPRRTGTWFCHWMLGEQVLASQKIRTISRVALNRSLRISATRFIVQDVEGRITLAKLLPDLDGLHRVGPCFWVSSSEPGVAGWCELEVHYRGHEGKQTSVLHKQKVLVNDGPVAVAPGTMEANFLHQVQYFELRCQNRVLGLLPLTSAPSATFTSEGGFSPPEDFPWSPTAEDQLNEKLNKLLGGKG